MLTTANPLIEVTRHGQSIWYDNIRRGLIESGELERLIDDDGLRGVTSNPAIFEKAIAGSGDYDDAIERLVAAGVVDPVAVYERVAVEDVRAAADRLLDVYDETERLDGYVSLEVSPKLAHDTVGTVVEAQRLWDAVGRPNLMIKVPATPEGIPAVRRLIGRGINVNVTLLFSGDVYEQVAEAYLGGLEDYAAGGGDAARVRSVASFFISRIDSAVDAALGAPQGAAVANARLTYQRFKHIYASARWSELATRGAMAQRLLWASTSSKDPRYADVAYVEQLIGHDTVNTVPPETYDAFRDHGVVRATLETDLDRAAQTMTAVAHAGVDFDALCARLLDDGLVLFETAFEAMLAAVASAIQTEGKD